MDANIDLPDLRVEAILTHVLCGRGVLGMMPWSRCERNRDLAGGMLEEFTDYPEMASSAGGCRLMSQHVLVSVWCGVRGPARYPCLRWILDGARSTLLLRVGSLCDRTAQASGNSTASVPRCKNHVSVQITYCTPAL